MPQHLRRVLIVTMMVLLTSCSTISNYQKKQKDAQYTHLENPISKDDKILVLTGTGSQILVKKKQSWWKGWLNETYDIPTLDLAKKLGIHLADVLSSHGYSNVLAVKLDPNTLLASGDILDENYYDIYSNEPNNDKKAKLHPEAQYYLKQIVQDFDGDIIILVKSSFDYSNVATPPNTIICENSGAEFKSRYHVIIIDAQNMKILAWRDNVATTELHNDRFCHNIHQLSDDTLFKTAQLTELSLSVSIAGTMGDIMNDVSQTPDVSL